MANVTMYRPDGSTVLVSDTPASYVQRFLDRGYSLTPVLPPVLDATARQLGTPGTQGAVVFRWDDGFASALTIARLASERKQRHTFGVTTGLLGQANYLTAAGVSAIAKAGHEIASHSVLHTSMVGLTSATRPAQYDGSKTTLEALSGVGKVTTWIYPLGGAARDAVTDAELWLRYERIMDTSGAANRRWAFPADTRQAGQFSVASLNLDGTAKFQAMAKSAIALAAREPVIVSFYSHDLGAAGSISLAQATELMDYAKSLQVPCISAREAWPGGPLLRNGGFEDADLSDWEIVPQTSQTATVVADAPVAGLPGTKSLKLTNAVAAETIYVEQEVPVVGGRSYTLGGRLRLSGAGDASNHIRLRIWQRGRDGAQTIAANNGTIVNAAAWTTATPLTVVLDPLTTFVKIGVLLTGFVGDGFADHLHFGPTAEGSFG